jgi:hypothetical protein
MTSHFTSWRQPALSSSSIVQLATGRVSSHTGREQAISTADSLHYWRKIVITLIDLKKG